MVAFNNVKVTSILIFTPIGSYVWLVSGGASLRSTFFRDNYTIITMYKISGAVAMYMLLIKLLNLNSF